MVEAQVQAPKGRPKEAIGISRAIKVHFDACVVLFSSSVSSTAASTDTEHENSTASFFDLVVITLNAFTVMAPRSRILYVTMQPSSDLPLAQFHDWYNNEHGRARLHFSFKENCFRHHTVDLQAPVAGS